jgi:hypothetical protein
MSLLWSLLFCFPFCLMLLAAFAFAPECALFKVHMVPAVRSVSRDESGRAPPKTDLVL